MTRLFHCERKRLLVAVGSALAALHPAVADEVLMRNGDRLTGQVLRQEGNQLRLKTDYAGTLVIDWSQVREVRLDEPASVLLEDETILDVASVWVDGERVTLHPVPRSQPLTVPVERVRVIEPEPWELGEGYQLGGRVNLAFEANSGNAESQELDIDFELNYRRRWDELKAFGQVEYDTTRGRRTTDSWTLHNKYIRSFPDTRMYGAAWLRFNHDRFADLRLRYVVGPALGYRFFASGTGRLSAEIGPIYINEHFYDYDDGDHWGPGLFIDYEQSIWRHRLQFYHRSMGFSAVSGSDKNLWQSWTGLRMPLGSGFVGGIEYEIDHDSQPAMNTQTTDETLRLKLGYQW